jgi:hypothetical protein
VDQDTAMAVLIRAKSILMGLFGSVYLFPMRKAYIILIQDLGKMLDTVVHLVVREAGHIVSYYDLKGCIEHPFFLIKIYENLFEIIGLLSITS